MSQTTTGEFTITTTTNPTPAATAANWKAIVTQKQEECKRKIPPAWLLPESITSALKWPLDTNPNKLLELDIPRSSGILTKRELSITEDFTVGELLGKLAAGQLSSVEVTVAFSKRAAIAQQLVSLITSGLLVSSLLSIIKLISNADKMLDRDILRRSAETRGGVGRTSCKRGTSGSLAWTTYQFERYLSYQGTRDQYWLCGSRGVCSDFQLGTR